MAISTKDTRVGHLFLPNLHVMTVSYGLAKERYYIMQVILALLIKKALAVIMEMQ